MNPTKQPWTAPEDKPSWLALAGWYLYALVIVTALIGYTIFFGSASAAFIYAGF